MKEKNNDYIMMILVVFIILFFLGGFIYVQNLKGTSTDKFKKEEKHITESKTPMNQSDDPIEAETEVTNDENKQIDTVEVTDIVPTPTNGIQSEEDVLQYIENMESSVVNSSQKDTSDWKVKAKKLFITVTDFIFYGGKIGEYTFQQLSDAGKQKVIQIAMNMDEVIETYSPNYKERLVSQGKRTYQTVSEKLTEYKNQYFQDVKTVIGEENYEKAGNVYDDVKEKASSVKDKVVDTSKNVYQQGKEAAGKVKDKWNDWYQSWKQE